MREAVVVSTAREHCLDERDLPPLEIMPTLSFRHGLGPVDGHCLRHRALLVAPAPLQFSANSGVPPPQVVS